MPASPVLLFDIDGTLLQSNGVGRQSVTAALTDLVGDTFDFSDVTFSGKTDPQIFREVLEAAGRYGLAVEGATPEAFRSLYEREMATRLPTATVDALPGAVALVNRLVGDGAEVGLLTGNIEAIAYDKVERIALGRELFPFGAFGSDHPDRDALPAIGARRATAHLGRTVETSELVIIGDTPRDIACARAAGAAVVAVATGRYSAAELAEADVVLDSLEAFSLDALGA